MKINPAEMNSGYNPYKSKPKFKDIAKKKEKEIPELYNIKGKNKSDDKVGIKVDCYA